MTFKKNLKTLISTLIIISTTTTLSLAHSGRTDSSGGHRDNKNKSGLGSYHYHHGYSAHLHTNDVCPYGSKSSSSNGSSNTGSKTTNTTSNTNNTESLKKKASQNGYNKGYEDGYNSNGHDSSNTSSYKEEYEEGYNKGFKQGVEDIDKKVDEIYQVGYEKGLTGEPSDNTQKLEKLKDSYSNGYNAGYNVYIEEKIKEYTNMGKEDSINFVEMKQFDETIDNKLKESYETAYNEQKTKLKLETVDEGFKFALQGNKYIVQNYEHKIKEDWFKEGYDNGINQLKIEKENAYNKGLNNEDYSLPNDLTLAKETIMNEYTKGVQEKKSEDSKNLAIGTASIGLIGAGIFGNKYYKKKKNKKYDK